MLILQLYSTSDGRHVQVDMHTCSSCLCWPLKQLPDVSPVLCTQGFQLPLTLVQQWQCHHLMDAAVGSSTGGKAGSSSGSKAAIGNTAALDKACQLLGAIACPSTPFRWAPTFTRHMLLELVLLAVVYVLHLLWAAHSHGGYRLILWRALLD